MTRSILDRRLLIVTGKGGTGKTTVSAALALAAQAAGKRVVVAEVGRDESIPRVLAGPSAPVAGYAGVELRPGLRVMRIDPFEALAEYLGLQFGMRTIVDASLRTAAFRQLMEASPGWRELITLGKVWHLEQMQDDRGERRYDLLIVDAPATGHGVTFLDVPRVVQSAIRAGPLRRNAGLVHDMIRDHENTALLPVSLGEELPARETAALVRRARDEIGIAVDRVIVNAMVEAPVEAGIGKRLCDALQGLDAIPGRRLPHPGVLARCLRHQLDRCELNERYALEIARDCELPLVRLPYVASGFDAPGALDRLAAALQVEPA